MAIPLRSLAANVAAATSANWAQRVRAGEQLSYWAHRKEAIPVLRNLILDPGDTAVTDATCAALLRRNDSHGLRVIAYAVAKASQDEYLYHIYDQVAAYLLPDGPIGPFLNTCTGLVIGTDTAIAEGARQLLQWARPWSGSYKRS